jgi:hypothetical protein
MCVQGTWVVDSGRTKVTRVNANSIVQMFQDTVIRSMLDNILPSSRPRKFGTVRSTIVVIRNTKIFSSTNSKGVVIGRTYESPKVLE